MSESRCPDIKSIKTGLFVLTGSKLAADLEHTGPGRRRIRGVENGAESFYLETMLFQLATDEVFQLLPAEERFEKEEVREETEPA